MEDSSPEYRKSKTTELFDKLNILWYLASLPDFWIEEVQLPISFQAIYDPYTKVLHYVMVVFALMSVGAFFTQHDLTPEQQHTIIMATSSCTTTIYRIVQSYYRDEIKKVIYYLTVYLKVFNDEGAERKLIRKIKYYAYVFISTGIGSMIARGISGGLQVYRGGCFVTFITIWPDVRDPSPIAEIARYIIYLIWYIILLQSVATVLMLVAVMLLICHQYENLSCYFNGLNEIFKDKRKSQAEKEREYEEKLVKGLQWHSITLWCVERCQSLFKIIFNTHMIVAPLIFISTLPELLDPEVDTKTKVEILPVCLSILACLGFFMWPAGDITVEAANLPEGLYGSGWQNCYGGNGVRVRKMIIFAMQQAQQPVVLKAFNTLEMSYESYVNIVKASYSLFSVMAI